MQEYQLAIKTWICNAGRLKLLREMNHDNKRKLPEDAPMNFIPAKLQGIVALNGIVDKRAWECALLTCLRNVRKTLKNY